MKVIWEKQNFNAKRCPPSRFHQSISQKCLWLMKNLFTLLGNILWDWSQNNSKYYWIIK